jgi:hypothetical protein
MNKQAAATVVYGIAGTIFTCLLVVLCLADHDNPIWGFLGVVAGLLTMAGLLDIANNRKSDDTTQPPPAEPDGVPEENHPFFRH